MTWLYSLMIAGLMLTSGNDLSISKKQNIQLSGFQNSSGQTVVKSDETEKFEQTYPLDANGTVSVSNINGSIVIEAWDNPQVKLEVVKTADSRETLDDVEVKIDARQNNFRAETDYDNMKNGGWRNGRRLEVSFHLIVPRTAVLDEIETVNGSVTVSNFTNYTKVSAVNGEVKATNLHGSASLSTVNGTVEADFQTLEAVKKISLETVNGKVYLTVPSDISATLKADSLNGNIINDFGLPVRKGQYVGRDLYGRIGSGDIQIRLNSVNGDLSVKRRGDGKNPNPAVNLLPQKGKAGGDDEDSDNDNDADEINADVAKSLADSQKEIAQARKEAAKANKEVQKELKNIQPQIDELKLNSIEQVTKVLNSADVQKQISDALQMQRETAMRNGDFNLAWSQASPVIEKKSETFDVKGTPKVTINAKGCAVSVRGWDKPEVSYSIKRFSKIPNQPAVDAKSTHTNSDVTIEVTGAAENAEKFPEEFNNIRIEIFVPQKANLKIVTDGQIRLEGVTGELMLNGENESINVRDAGGNLHVVSGEGLIRIVGFKGEIDSKTGTGQTYLEGDFNKLSAVTEDGEITLTLPENTDANVESNLDKIAADGIALNSSGGGDGANTWKIGKGGAKFRLISESDGKITVRGKNTLLNQN